MSKYDEQVKAALEFINKTPVVQSCLYDLNMLPEQLQRGSKEFDRMLILVNHFFAAKREWKPEPHITTKEDEDRNFEQWTPSA